MSFDYVVPVRGTVKQQREMREWCIEQFDGYTAGRWFVISGDHEPNREGAEIERTHYFSNVEDAAFFKLRWGGS